jgi:thiol-disulfide isomerase/thioredoxin
MLSFSLGPFSLALSHLLLLAALVLATFVGWLSGRRQQVNPERALFGLFVLGLLLARMGFVLVYWTQYQNHLPSIIDIRDGGFLVWPGVVAVVIGALVHGFRRPALRPSMGMGVVSGLVFWWLASLAVSASQQDARLPNLTLRNAAGEAVQLSDYQGKKLVINLWATWCPPCRREMPVLQAAQQSNLDVVFLFVNQAETPREVGTFLTSQGLQLNNVLFDDTGELARRVGSAALPTTLFYRPDGRLSASHLGELSNASLTHALGQIGEPATLASSQTRSTQ